MRPLPQPSEPPGMPLAGRHAIVFGMGKSGLAVTEFLAARQVAVTVVDEGPPHKLSEALDRLAELKVAGLAGLTSADELPAGDLMVVSPGVSVSHPFLQAARAEGVEVIGEIELAWRFCSAPIIAVTGTNGKGTTSSLLGGMLRACGLRCAVGGNIGNPLIGLVGGDWQAVVAEVSSFQLETTVGFHPWAAILLNITSDHISRHGDLEHYVAAKLRLFDNQRPDDLAVLNLDDPQTAAVAGQAQSERLAVRLHDRQAAGYLESDSLTVHLPGSDPVRICHRSDLPLRGEHYMTDALCAGVVAVAAGCGGPSLLAAVRSWKPAPHQMQQVAIVSDVRFVDDSKATNPGSAVADLRAVEGPVLVIACGQTTGADLSDFADELARRARGVYLIGEGAQEIVDLIANRTIVCSCASLEEAVQMAFADAEPGDTVMLCPACASFDQFAGQADRGERFTAAVRGLAPWHAA